MLRGLRQTVKRGLWLLGRCRSLRGYEARAEVIDRPEALRTYAVTTWRLKVHNLGTRPWPAGGLHKVRLGYHWRAADGGAYVPFDNGDRTPLPRPLRPGDAAVVDCPVRTPHTAGRYRLEFDLERNFVGWFGGAGNAPLAVDCELTWPRARDGDEFDYHAFYRRFDLDKDYWSVVGPGTREEFEFLGRGKLRQLISLGLNPASRVLDVGCGTGQLAQALLDYLSPEGRYYGTDLAEEAVAFCRKTYRRPNFSFVRNEMTGVPVREMTFDFIYLGSVFTHMFPDEVRDMLIDLRRLLAPGGVVLADVFVATDVATFRGGRGMVEVNEAFLNERLTATGLAFETFGTQQVDEQLKRRFLTFRLPAAADRRAS